MRTATVFPHPFGVLLMHAASESIGGDIMVKIRTRVRRRASGIACLVLAAWAVSASAGVSLLGLAQDPAGTTIPNGVPLSVSITAAPDAGESVVSVGLVYRTLAAGAAQGWHTNAMALAEGSTWTGVVPRLPAGNAEYFVTAETDLGSTAATAATPFTVDGELGEARFTDFTAWASMPDSAWTYKGTRVTYTNWNCSIAGGTDQWLAIGAKIASIISDYRKPDGHESSRLYLRNILGAQLISPCPGRGRWDHLLYLLHTRFRRIGQRGYPGDDEPDGGERRLGDGAYHPLHRRAVCGARPGEPRRRPSCPDFPYGRGDRSGRADHGIDCRRHRVRQRGPLLSAGVARCRADFRDASGAGHHDTRDGRDRCRARERRHAGAGSRRDPFLQAGGLHELDDCRRDDGGRPGHGGARPSRRGRLRLLLHRCLRRRRLRARPGWRRRHPADGRRVPFPADDGHQPVHGQHPEHAHPRTVGRPGLRHGGDERFADAGPGALQHRKRFADGGGDFASRRLHGCSHGLRHPAVGRGDGEGDLCPRHHPELRRHPHGGERHDRRQRHGFPFRQWPRGAGDHDPACHGACCRRPHRSPFLLHAGCGQLRRHA
jgi:hypothetical protein